MSEDVLPVFSAGSFVVSCLTVVDSWLVPQTKNVELILLSTCL